MEKYEFVIRILAAMIAGFLVGFEREINKKSAGLKTNTLVSVGACAFVFISLNFVDYSDTDVTRIIGQVVTGIGFLGAGVILKQGNDIRGLTTAATVWCSSAIGCLAGVGMYFELVVTTGAILIVNTLVNLFENWLQKKIDK